MSDAVQRKTERAAKADGDLASALKALRLRCRVGDHTIGEETKNRFPVDWAESLAKRLGYKDWTSYLTSVFCAVCGLERRKLTLIQLRRLPGEDQQLEIEWDL